MQLTVCHLIDSYSDIAPCQENTYVNVYIYYTLILLHYSMTTENYGHYATPPEATSHANQACACVR